MSAEAWTKDKLDDYIRGTLKDVVGAEVAERFKAESAKAKEAFDGASFEEKSARIKAAMNGDLDRGPNGDLQVRGKSKLWFLEGKEDDNYELGGGMKFADLLPFVFKSKAALGRLDWQFIAEAAEKGIEHQGRRLTNKSVAEGVKKALNSETAAAGETLIPEDFSSDFVGYLYGNTVVRRAGARTIEMPNGKLDLGRQNSTATAYWLSTDTTAITASEESFGRLTLEAKKLGVLVAMSNDVLRRVPRGLEALVRDDMTVVASLAEDVACLRGDGTGGSPTGILNAVDAGNKFASTGTTTSAIISDLARMIYKVRKARVPMSNCAWILPVRFHSFLMQLQDADSNLVSFMQQLANGTLMGFPVYVSNQIPDNLGVGLNETEIYFGDFSQALIGETLNVRIDASPHANIAGAQDLFGQDMQALRLIHEMDFALRHTTAFAVQTGNTVGASWDA